MDKKIIKFDDTEIQEYEFHQYKNPILINNIDTDKVVVSNKFPLCTFFPEMSIYKRYSDKTKCMYFMIKD